VWSHKLLRDERIEFNSLTMLNATSAPPFNKFKLLAAPVSTLVVAYGETKTIVVGVISPGMAPLASRDTSATCAYAGTTKPESSQLRSLAEGPIASICFNQPFALSDELAA
jgi:hypothetical protein